MRTYAIKCLLLLSCVCALVACGPSAEGIKAEVAKAATCTTSEDCVLLSAKCPIGCYVAVNKSEEERIKSMIAGFSENCAYDCLAADGAICENGACKVVTKE